MDPEDNPILRAAELRTPKPAGLNGKHHNTVTPGPPPAPLNVTEDPDPDDEPSGPAPRFNPEPEPEPEYDPGWRDKTEEPRGAGPSGAAGTGGEKAEGRKAPGGKAEGGKRERIALEIASFADLAETEPPETATLLGDHWLFRCGWNVIIGPTGQGKTSISAQMGALWCLGFEAFGIKPNGKLRIMLVQVENDQADLHEMTEGILAEIGATPEERQWLRENFLVVTPKRPTPDLFATDGEITELIAEWKPDLVLLDSLYKWTPKGNAADSEGLFHTIDQTLLPLAKSLNFGLLASHHMGRTEVLRIANGESNPLSDLYSGAGGMFVADNARGTLLLLPEGDEPGNYVLRGAKRKSRLGWRDKEGVKVYEKHLQWAEGRIGWREVDEATAARRRQAGEGKKAAKEFNLKTERIVWSIREVGGGSGEWVERADVSAVVGKPGAGPYPKGISDRAFRDFLPMIRDIVEDATMKNANNREAVFVRLKRA